MSLRQPLEEILEEIKAAEERWQKLLNENKGDATQIKKEDILNIGPKPIKLKSKTYEPIIPKVQLPIIKKNRGDFRSRRKCSLNILKIELQQATCPKIKTSIEEKIKIIKIELKNNLKQKKKKNKEKPNRIQ